jgi:hypothetical protein
MPNLDSLRQWHYVLPLGLALRQTYGLVCNFNGIYAKQENCAFQK